MICTPVVRWRDMLSERKMFLLSFLQSSFYLPRKALGDAAGRVQITPALVTAIGLSRHDLFDNIKLKEQLDPLGMYKSDRIKFAWAAVCACRPLCGRWHVR